MANSKFVAHYGIDSQANTNVTGDLYVSGNAAIGGTLSYSGVALGDFLPSADGDNLGNTTLRWDLFGGTANISSTLVVGGATTISNTIQVSGAATFQNTLTTTGQANVGANLNVVGLANIAGNTYIGGFVNVSTSVTAGGLANITGNVSFTNTIVTATTNSTANVVTVGAANVSVDSGVLFVDSVNNRVGINNTAPGVALRVTGDVDISATANIQGSTTVTGSLTANGNTSLTNSLLALTTNSTASVLTIGSANTNIDSGTFFVDATTNRVGINNTAPGVALSVTGAANISTSVNSALLTVDTAFIANTTGAYHTGIISANGNTSFTNAIFGLTTNSTANVLTIGAANTNIDSGVLFVDSVNNRVGINNTAPGVALRVTGDTDISGTANIQGNANIGGNLGIAGLVTLSGNTTLSGSLQTIAGNSNFDSGVLFVDSVNNRVGINNTAPTVALEVAGAANVSTSVNSALLTVGTAFIANTTGVYSTGVANAASFTTSGISANATALVPISNTVGQILGNTISRWVLTANSGNFSGNVLLGNTTTNTLIAPQSYASNTSGAVTGTVTTIGTTVVSGTGTVFTNDLVAGDVIKFSSCTAYFTVQAISNSTQIVLTTNSPSVSGDTVEKKNIQTVNNSGVFLYGAGQTVTPFSNATTSTLGNSTARWIISANTIHASGLITAAGGMDLTGSISASVYQIASINSTSNGFIANSTVVAVGNSTVNTVIDSTGIRTGGTTGVSPYANGSDLGTLTARWDVYAANTDVSGVLAVGNNATFSGNVSITSGANPTLFVGTSVTVNTSGVYPASNTLGSALGTATQRFDVYGDTGFFGGVLTANGGLTVEANPMTANGTTGTSGQVLTSNGTIGAPYWSTISAGGGTPEGANTQVQFNNSGVFGGDSGFTYVASSNTLTVVGPINGGAITASGVLSGASADISGSITGNSLAIAGTANANIFNAASTLVGGSSTYGSSASVSTSLSTGTTLTVGTKLSVNGSFGTAGQMLYSGGTTNTYWAAAPASGGTPGGSSTHVQYNNAGAFAGSASFTFAVGSGTLSATIMTTTSDERLKTNIQTISGGLDMVSRMRGVSYEFKDSGHKGYGVIAQEIQDILPNVVHTNEDGFMKVSYNDIIGVLIEAIKDLKQEINEMKNGNQS